MVEIVLTESVLLEKAQRLGTLKEQMAALHTQLQTIHFLESSGVGKVQFEQLVADVKVLISSAENVFQKTERYIVEINTQFQTTDGDLNRKMS